MNDEFYKKIGIPEGHYCYEIVAPIHRESPYGKFVVGHKVKYCPFWYGFRPDGGCMICGWDAALGDAIKSCGFLEPDEPIF